VQATPLRSPRRERRPRDAGRVPPPPSLPPKTNHPTRPLPPPTSKPQQPASSAASKPKAPAAKKPAASKPAAAAAAKKPAAAAAKKTAPAAAAKKTSAAAAPKTKAAPVPAAAPKRPAAAAKPAGGGKAGGAKMAVGGKMPAFSVIDHEGNPVTSADLLARCSRGVLIFTYPKANTGGCHKLRKQRERITAVMCGFDGGKTRKHARRRAPKLSPIPRFAAPRRSLPVPLRRPTKPNQKQHPNRQACGMRDNYAELQALGFDVYGLSGDNPTPQANWRAKGGFQYTLLCGGGDGRAALKALGVDKGGSSVIRSHFLIAKDGTVLQAMVGISPGDSIEGALAGAKEAAAAGK
jgi:peroxiredoxin